MEVRNGKFYKGKMSAASVVFRVRISICPLKETNSKRMNQKLEKFFNFYRQDRPLREKDKLFRSLDGLNLGVVVKEIYLNGQTPN